MRRALTLTVAAAGTAALIVPLAATADHRPGHEKADRNPNLSIAADPTTVLWARPTTISGKLTGSDNEGKTVELQENPFPFTGPFDTVGPPTTTNAQGEYSFEALPREHTNYRVVAQTQPPETSGEVTVRVRMRINRRVSDRRPDRGDKVTFSGKVAPAHDGLTVRLQRKRPSGTWKTVKRTTLEDAGADDEQNSVYSMNKKIRRKGVYRTRVQKHDDHLGNKSRKIRVRIDD
jgi:hypothetical protein